MDRENTLLGHYTLHRKSPLERPTLYLVDVESLRLPTVGIPDVGCAGKNTEAQAASSLPDLLQAVNYARLSMCGCKPLCCVLCMIT